MGMIGLGRLGSNMAGRLLTGIPREGFLMRVDAAQLIRQIVRNNQGADR